MPLSWAEPIFGIIDDALQENEDLMALLKSLDLSYDELLVLFSSAILNEAALPQDVVNAVNDAMPDIVIRGLSSNQGDLVLEGKHFFVETVPGSGMFTNPWSFGGDPPYAFGGTCKFYLICIYLFTSFY